MTPYNGIRPQTVRSSIRPGLALLTGILTASVWMASHRSGGAVETSTPELSLTLGNLKGIWRFTIDPRDQGEAVGMHRPDYEDASWKGISVPGSWESQSVVGRDQPGNRDYDGVAWYRTRFRLPSAWSKKRLVLVLGSVDDADRVFINGRKVGETPITRPQAVLVQRVYRLPAGAVRYGEVNTIAVKVTDGGGPGGIMGPNVGLVPEDFLFGRIRLPASNRPLADRFDQPPADARILKIIHNWPDEPQQQDVLIRGLAGQGFGGVVSNVSFTDYLISPSKWKAFLRGTREAQTAGMSQWLYDEKGYPSGLAGGLTLQDHPEWRARGLMVSLAVTSGEPVQLQAPPGIVLLAHAYPETDGDLDVSAGVQLAIAGGQVRWTPPHGRWHAMIITEGEIYEGTHAAHNLSEHTPYVNLLMAEPTARFLELTHDAYAKHLGGALGKRFVSTFTDEPSLMSLYLSRMPYGTLPWAPDLEAEFRQRRGYDLRPKLPRLVSGRGPQAARVRYDFWKTVAELVSDRYFGQIRRWCDRHGIQSGGHLLFEEPLTAHVPLYGDFFACVRQLSAPSIDCLTSIPAAVPWYIARMIGSVADLEGHAVTMSETSDHVQVWRRRGDTTPLRIVTEAEIRGTCNRLVLSGINTITSYYSFRDLDDAALIRLNEYVGRICTMLRGGYQVADIAVLYPVESVWTRFVPSRHVTSDAVEALRVERSFRTVSDLLFSSRNDFTYIDSRAIIEGKVENGILTMGRLPRRIVILPKADTLPAAAWDQLEKLVRTGGVVIAMGNAPSNSEREFPSAALVQRWRGILGEGSNLRVRRYGQGLAAFIPDGAEAVLPVLLGSILEPDVTLDEAEGPIRVTHRRIEEHDVYFLINDGPQPWSGPVTLRGEGPGELWNPRTGTHEPIDGDRPVRVELEPYSGAFLRFKSARRPHLSLEAGFTAPRMEASPLPLRLTDTGAGEFVRGACRLIEPAAGAANARWEVAGDINKSGVDTYLFAHFRTDAPIDFSGLDYVRLQIRIPSAQPGAPELLVILTDSRGVQYVSDTGYRLSDAGEYEVLLARSRFAHAAFSRGPAGPLDWSAIASVSVGWGGYYGTEGERLVFEIGLPERGRFAR